MRSIRRLFPPCNHPVRACVCCCILEVLYSLSDSIPNSFNIPSPIPSTFPPQFPLQVIYSLPVSSPVSSTLPPILPPSTLHQSNPLRNPTILHHTPPSFLECLHLSRFRKTMTSALARALHHSGIALITPQSTTALTSSRSAGFGNRATDELSYLAVSFPPHFPISPVVPHPTPYHQPKFSPEISHSIMFNPCLPPLLPPSGALTCRSYSYFSLVPLTGTITFL